MDPIYQTQVATEEIDTLIQELYPVVKDKPAALVVTTLIAMIVMSLYPNLEEEELINTIETASQLLATLQPTGGTPQDLILN